MKKFAKILSLVMIMAILLSMTAVLASAADGKGSITIKNATKGETYSVVKLFDANISGTGGIVYTGNIPTSLEDYFTKNQYGEISATATELSEEAIKKMTEWAKAELDDDTNAGISHWTAVAGGSELVFDNLPYGYYVIVSSLGGVISVNSTNPNVAVNDKNTKIVTAVKSVNDPDVYIGQEVTYTLTVDTVNWVYPLIPGTSDQDTSKDPQYVTEYVIEDTLPEWLSDVKVISISIGGEAKAVQQFDSNKQIIIDWYDEATSSHLYKNGAQIVITYTAVVNREADVDGAGNTNKLTVYVETNETGGDEYWQKFEDEETIWTYGLAMQKVDPNGDPLDGASFMIAGLTVEEAVEGSKGDYIVKAYDPAGTTGTTMYTDSNGMLIIRGVASQENQLPITYVLTELKAPDGYNMLKESKNLQVKVLNEVYSISSAVIYYDADGNVIQDKTQYHSSTNVITYNQSITAETILVEIVNQKGVELPETGGIGTSLFLAFGSMTALCAAVVLVARKKAAGYR